MKYDLTVLGTITNDTILYIDNLVKSPGNNSINKITKRPGGIFNMIPVLEKSGLNISIRGNIGKNNSEMILDYMEDHKDVKYNLYEIEEDTREVVEVIDLNNSKTAFVKNGEASNGKNIEIEKSRWTHISYLDVINELNLKEIKKKSGVLSADLCITKPSDKIKKYMRECASKYVDMFIISEDEYNAYFDDITLYFSQSLFRSWIVMHTNNKTHYLNSRNTKVIPSPVKPSYRKDINILGAGDNYCAQFIVSQLNNKSIEDSAIDAHKAASDHVLKGER